MRKYEITAHAKEQFVLKYPETVLGQKPNKKHITVPHNAEQIGYDEKTKARYLQLPNSPMVAVVVEGRVVTFIPTNDVQNRLPQLPQP